MRSTSSNVIRSSVQPTRLVTQRAFMQGYPGVARRAVLIAQFFDHMVGRNRAWVRTESGFLEMHSADLLP